MRLIDADELKEKIASWLKPIGKPDETEMVSVDDIAISVYKTIEEQPTAYDVDKVVEQITDLTAETFKVVDDSAYIPATKVMDIVKEGGVNVN